MCSPMTGQKIEKWRCVKHACNVYCTLQDDPPTLDRGNVAARNRTHEINAKINVAPAVAGRHVSRSQRKVCLSSVHSNASEPLRILSCGACSWRLKLLSRLRVARPREPRNITSDGRACCMLSTSMQSAHLRRQPKRGGCFSWTDLVVVQHMCLSGFDRLDTLFAKNWCTRSTPSDARLHLSQVSSTLKTNKDLDPIYVLVFVIV